MNEPYIECFASPIGVVEIQASNDAITSIAFVETFSANQSNDITHLAVSQLKEYFSSDRTEFELPLSAEGTAFQHRVWTALLTIPFGETWSYQELASSVDNPNAVRAVGSANAHNPHAIVVPCHRVIASSGKLSGYAGGVERKAWLLNHEANTLF